MRVAWLVAGTRGDVQPAAVVLDALRRRGHEVVLGAPGDLTRLGAALGVRSVPLGFDVGDLLRSEEGTAWLTAGADQRRYLAGLLRFKEQHLDALAEAMLTASEGADVLIGGNLLRAEATAVATLRRASLVLPGYAPRWPNSAYPPIGAAPSGLPAVLNRTAHRIVAGRIRRMTAPSAALFRRRLGLSAAPPRQSLGRRGGGHLEPQLYSRSLVPRLADRPLDRPLLGFVTPTAAQQAAWSAGGVDADLDAWIAGGSAPVWFGFGSMPLRCPAETVAMVRRAARRLGVRALIGIGPADAAAVRAAADDDLRVVGEIDHAAVLARCRAAVHHGGAGTTATSVGAGLPTLVCAVAFDQPFWGQRLAEVGAGAWMPFRELTEDSLVAALRPLLDPAAAARAGAVGDRLRHDRAVPQLVDLLESLPAR